MTAARTRLLLSACCALTLSLSTARAWGDPPAHLVPFPEDAVEQAAEKKPVKPAPPKSDFQPRFRSPNLKPAEPLQPASKDEKSEGVVQTSASEPIAEDAVTTADEGSAESQATEDGPQLLPEPAPVDASGLSGREALNEAFKRSKAAEAESDYTDIIALCESGKVGVPKQYQDYANNLMGWAYNRRGEARARAGDETQALTDFETAVRLSGAWRAIHNRGVSYAAAGRMEDALADFNRTISINPNFPNAYYNRGELRYRQDDYTGAIDDFTRALELGPPDAVTFNSRGHAFYRIQRFGDALRDYGEAIKLDPTNPDPLINRGDTHSDLGQYGEAAADYRAAVQVAPESGRAFQAAAWLMSTCPDSHYRDEKLAIDAANRAIELDGPTYRNLSTLAAAQASAKQFDAAKTTQEKAIAAAPEDQVLTGEKMMALYQRDLAFRDRPLTAFDQPEDTPEEEIRQANAQEFKDRINLSNRRAMYQAPVQERQQPAPANLQGKGNPAARYSGGQQGSQSRPPQQLPPQYQQPRQTQPQQPTPAPRARLFGPRGNI